jgi:hypothetical protein
MKTTELKEQMELTLETRSFRRSRGGKKRLGRARWWFSQMRQTVDRAIDWTPQPLPRAHQVYFTMERETPNW